jgi:hypothetical protein
MTTTLLHGYGVRRVVSRLNSEFCIPLFLGFYSGLNKSTSERENQCKSSMYLSFHRFIIIKKTVGSVMIRIFHR